LCRQQGRAETQRLFGQHGRLLARYEPSLLELAGVAEAPEPAELPAEAARLRLFESLAESFTALARRKPLLLALDDLHWADELTLGWLGFLVRRQEAGASGLVPLLLLGAYRSEEPSEVLDRLARSPRTSHLVLERLGEEPPGRIEEAQQLYKQALDLHRRLGDRRFEGIVLGNLARHRELGNRHFEGVVLFYQARLERLAGSLDQAEQLVSLAESIQRSLHDLHKLADCLCEHGLVALARAEEAGPFLAEAETLAATPRVGAGSALDQNLSRLRRALEAHRSGRPLLRGERPEDLPEALRRRIEDSGLSGMPVPGRGPAHSS
jgi:tetratricopeptide (TPR) repeat protein